jgi:type 1 fimbria pilin
MRKIVLTTLVGMFVSSMSYADEIRVSTNGTVDFKGTTLSVGEEIREGLDNIDVTKSPTYRHTELGVSKSIYGVDVGVVLRNTNSAGANRDGVDLNRVAVTGTTSHTLLGLDLTNRVQIQNGINDADLRNIELGTVVVREMLLASKAVALRGKELTLTVGDEIFLGDAGLIENRVFAGAAIGVCEGVSLGAGYFLKSEGALIDTSGNTGSPANSHVVTAGVTLSF